MYKQKYSVTMDNRHNKYKVISKAVYNKFIGLVHEHKKMSKKYSFLAIKYINIIRILIQVEKGLKIYKIFSIYLNV